MIQTLQTTRARVSTLALAFLLAALVVALFALASPAWAATFAVTKTADTNDGTCDADCSLREAITAANTAPGRDSVNVPAGTYTLSIAGANEDANATGDLDITEQVDIVGAGARTTTVDAAGIDRVFDEVTSGAAPTVISGLTITGGDSPAASDGGGVVSRDRLTLREVAVDGNEANNFGGGIFSGGDSMLIERSTVSNNLADEGGGGVDSLGNALTIDNSTIANNKANDSGGGLSETGSAVLTIKNSTFADNTADADNDGDGVGGGLAFLDTTTFRNTIVARNTDAASSNADNCQVDDSATTVSNGFNLEDANTCEFDQPSDDIATPNMGTLANNGGPTDTIALLPGSPAIDTGNADVALDQRKVTRPQDGDNNGSSIDDRGAFEQETAPPPQCSDGLDNDTDGKTDFGGANGDPGCESATDNSESPDPPPPPPPGCTIAGTPGNDTLIGTSGNDSICGRGGNDRIDAGSGHDTVRGGDGNDTILGGSGSDTLSGESGDDTARGGAGNDDLSGGSGSDKLFGEAGKDALNARDGVQGNDLADGGASADACTTDNNDRKVSCP